MSLAGTKPEEVFLDHWLGDDFGYGRQDGQATAKETLDRVWKQLGLLGSEGDEWKTCEGKRGARKQQRVSNKQRQGAVKQVHSQGHKEPQGWHQESRAGLRTRARQSKSRDFGQEQGRQQQWEYQMTMMKRDWQLLPNLLSWGERRSWTQTRDKKQWGCLLWLEGYLVQVYMESLSQGHSGNVLGGGGQEKKGTLKVTG